MMVGGTLELMLILNQPMVKVVGLISKLGFVMEAEAEGLLKHQVLDLIQRVQKTGAFLEIVILKPRMSLDMN